MPKPEPSAAHAAKEDAPNEAEPAARNRETEVSVIGNVANVAVMSITSSAAYQRLRPASDSSNESAGLTCCSSSCSSERNCTSNRRLRSSSASNVADSRYVTVDEEE